MDEQRTTIVTGDEIRGHRRRDGTHICGKVADIDPTGSSTLIRTT
jgi:hypothetical protein